MFLLNQNNRNMWVEWFKCPFDLGMIGAGISSKNTYYNCLKELEESGLIKYEKGMNNFKAPKISIVPLSSVPKNDTVTVPLSEPLTGTLSKTLSIPLSEPLNDNIYKLVTSNIKLITSNIEKVLSFLNSESSVEIVFPYDSEEFKLAWKNWKQYRSEIKKPYKNSMSEQAALKQLSNFNEKFSINLIEISIANNYQGLVFSNTHEAFQKFLKEEKSSGQKEGKFSHAIEQGYRMQQLRNQMNGHDTDN